MGSGMVKQRHRQPVLRVLQAVRGSLGGFVRLIVENRVIPWTREVRVLMRD